jgi:ParB-like chromosome segregation protein Spo0J
MHIRDRITELRRVRAGSLRPHPRNWRTHPPSQQAAVRGILAEVGFADALIARQLPDGTLQLIDGHLRAELTPDALVPVLVLDVTEDEALILLAALDPLSAAAETDAALLGSLLADVHTESEALATLLAELAAENPVASELSEDSAGELAIPASYQVVVQCADEDQQRDVYERLRAEGLRCRVLSL